jgi:heparosan-N-sulfate-glucuronate 5-epimerase
MKTAKLMRDVAGALAGSRRFRSQAGVAGARYPLGLEFTLDDTRAFYEPFDEHGIPRRRYATVGVQYNPTRVAGFALANWNRLLDTDREEHRAAFLRAAEWFWSRQDGLWTYLFPWNDLRPPWLSCMAQGEGISVLVRAYRLTGEQRFLDRAVEATRPFCIPVEEGGVRSVIAGGGPFLEEYPARVATHTLNGFLFAMVGIEDLQSVYPRARADTGAEALMETLASSWQLWDLGFWSAYDASVDGGRNPATIYYHNIHISLLEFLATAYDSQALHECARQWERYAASLRNRTRALGGKIWYRLRHPAAR